MKLSIKGILVLATIVFLMMQLPLASAELLRLDKNAFNPGENIQVYFEASGSFDRSAWVGIVPSTVAHGSEAENDKYDLTYQYLEKRTSGTLTFNAPQEPGSYDLRMFDTDNNGKEVASVTFFVEVAKGILRLDKNLYRPGEDIIAGFEASDSYDRSAWVGIVPSTVAHGSEAENDKYDLTYQYLEKRTSGTLTFNAPQEPGSYDLRMFDTDNNGKEVASITFSVEDERGTLSPCGEGATDLSIASPTDQYKAGPGLVPGSYKIWYGKRTGTQIGQPDNWNTLPVELLGGKFYVFDVSTGDFSSANPQMINPMLSNPTPDESVVWYKASTQYAYVVCFEGLSPSVGGNSTSSHDDGISHLTE